MSLDQERADYAQYVYGNYSPSLMITAGQGARLIADDGRSYLDFGAGISVCNLGHCHPDVVAAVQEQAARLMHCSNLYMNPQAPALARRIAELSLGGRVFFCNSGAEANEAMIKLARRWGHAEGGRHEIICMHEAFHGRTLGTLAATGRAKYREGFAPDLQGFRHVPFNDIGALEAAVNEHTVAIMLELVQGEGGVSAASPAFVQAARRLCDERNMLLLVDEVQTAFCRTGSYFAYEHFGVKPDVISLAKALGNGFPIGAISVRPGLDKVLTPGTHGTTFGGNPLACAAGLAVLATMARDDIPAQAKALGETLRAALAAEQARNPFVLELRGIGPMIGIRLAPGCKPATLQARCRELGLLVLSAGEDVIRLLPPLTLTATEAAEGLAILIRSLQEIQPDA